MAKVLNLAWTVLARSGTVAALAAGGFIVTGCQQQDAAPAPQAAAPAAQPVVTQAAAPATPAAKPAPAKQAAKPVTWQELSAEQQSALAPLEQDWNSLEARQQRRWLQFASRYPKLSEVDQLRSQERMREWAAMTPEQRLEARSTYRQAQAVPKEERLAHWEQYQTLTEDQKKILSEYGVGHETAATRVQNRTGLARQSSKPLAAIETPSGNQH